MGVRKEIITFKKTLLIFLMILNSFLFIFSLLLGAERFGVGWVGILNNFPNALSWLFLYGLIYLLNKKEFLGGVFLSGAALFLLIIFDFWEHWFPFFIIFLPLEIIALFFIKIGWEKKKEQNV